MTVYSTTDGAATPARGFEADELPVSWTSDGTRLLVLSRGTSRQLIAIDPSTGARAVEKTFIPPSPTLLGPNQYIATPDGRSYVLNYQERRMTLFVAEGLR